jgi:RNA polymerase primary sigma factor
VQVLRDHFAEFVGLLKEHGRDDERSRAAMAKVSEDFLQFKLVANVFNELVEMLRGTIERIRGQERLIMGLCIDNAGMPRKEFINSFPDNETNLDWVREQIDAGKAYSAAPRRGESEVRRAQRRCRTWSARTCSPSARSRRSTARCPSARPRPAAPRRRWSRPTCVW